MTLIRTYWKPVVAGLLGVSIGLAAWLILSHVWTDHQTLHQIVLYLNQNAQKAAGAAK